MAAPAKTPGNVFLLIAIMGSAKAWHKANSVISTQIVMLSCFARGQRCGPGRTGAPNWEHHTNSAKKHMNAHLRITVGLLRTLIRKNQSRNACHCTHRITELASAGRVKTILSQHLTITNTMVNTVRLGLHSQTTLKEMNSLHAAQAQTTSTSTAKRLNNLTHATQQIMRLSASYSST
jgi:hypothetical protein